MTLVQWKRVGADLFISDPGENDGLRHPSSEEFDALIACWDRYAVEGRFRCTPIGGRIESAASSALVEHMVKSNRRTWLEHQALGFGTENQRERYALSLLPYEELLALARAELFKLFDAKRWRPLSYSTVRHRPECAGRVDITSGMLYTTWRRSDADVPQHETTSLAHDVWENYKRVLRTCEFLRADHQWLAGLPETESVRATVHEHTARCVECPAFTKAWSVRVIIPWGGYNLTREYAL